MNMPLPKLDAEAPIVVVDIGNSTINIATWHAGQVKTPLAVPNDGLEAFGKALDAHLRAIPAGRPAVTAVASVVPEALDRLRDYLADTLGREPLVVGERIPFPIDVEVRDLRAVGVDRVCSAAAAYDKLQTSCTIIDFGSAVTVDLVDDEGVLVGGSILPGLKMQLKALHEGTAALPAVEPAFPPQPFGRDTVEAMQNGVCRGLAGAVRGLVEGYAVSLNKWPQVLATGGDVSLMMPHCDFIDACVSHLVLRGIGIACAKHLAEAGA